MVYKINVKKSWTIFFCIPFGFFFFLFIYLFIQDSDLAKQILIIFLPIILFIIYFTMAFIFFRSIKIEKDNLLLHFGPQLIHKKYYYRDMKDIRYAKKGDYILRGQPAYGITEKTVAITFKDETMYFISVEQTSEFYELLLNKITEANSEFSET